MKTPVTTKTLTPHRHVDIRTLLTRKKGLTWAPKLLQQRELDTARHRLRETTPRDRDISCETRNYQDAHRHVVFMYRLHFVFSRCCYIMLCAFAALNSCTRLGIRLLHIMNLPRSSVGELNYPMM